MSRPTAMTIDLSALQHNFSVVRKVASHCSIIAMVKANAYGHGIVRVASALTQSDAFGVASLEEAIALREAGVEQPIILMEGVFTEDELPLVAQYNCVLVVHHLPHVEMLAALSGDYTFNIWLKINTGMHRLGVSIEQLPEIYRRLMHCPTVKKPIGLMTHFAEADILESSQTEKQIDLFTQATAAYEGPRSLANSAGILAWPASHGQWVRPGLMLYGATPFKDKIGTDFNLKPVMTLSSKLIAIHHVKTGAKIGYGGTWQAPEEMRVGIVGIGYGDGYPQQAPNGTPLLVNAKRCALIGRVSMDMLAVDLRLCQDAGIGDKVILWGEGLPVEEIARHCQTSAWEILTRMTPRPKLAIKN